MFNSIQQVKQANEDLGHFFWSKDTNAFFKDKPSNWELLTIKERMFIRNKNRRHRLHSQVREVFSDGAIGTPIECLNGLTKKEVITAVNRGFMQFEYIVADCFLSAIINGDYSGLSDGDTQALKNFLYKIESRGHWDIADDVGFCTCNVTGLKANCAQLVYELKI